MSTRVRPRYWLLWHGGANYAVPHAEDALAFSSLAAIRDHMEICYSNRGGSTPAVDRDATGHIFRTHPADVEDAYPDYTVRMGRRGGWVVEQA